MEPASTRTVTARAPTRIDFGGGWTDVPPYDAEHGGFVCNVAIDRYATATLRAAETYRGGGTPAPAPDPLITAAVKRAGSPRVHATVASEFPVGAGLGGSSAALAAVVTALDAWNGVTRDAATVAELGRTIEVDDLGVTGGRQDHYAATFGGALALEFTNRVHARRLAVSAATCEALERRSVLVYTGESRISGDTVRGVIDAYRAGDRRVLDALDAMQRLARRMADVLEAGALDELGALVAEHWTHQRSLHPAIPTARIDEIIARGAAAGATGAKATGASGGGCVYLLASDDTIGAVRRAVAPLGDLLDFHVAPLGARVVA